MLKYSEPIISCPKANSTEDMNRIKVYLTDLSYKSNGASEILMVQAVRASKDMGDSTLTMALRKNWINNILNPSWRKRT